MVTICTRCGGDLRITARFCTTVALRCGLCRAWFSQAVPPAVAVTIQPA